MKIEEFPVPKINHCRGTLVAFVGKTESKDGVVYWGYGPISTHLKAYVRLDGGEWDTLNAWEYRPTFKRAIRQLSNNKLAMLSAILLYQRCPECLERRLNYADGSFKASSQQ